jgi:hypothetical protein
MLSLLESREEERGEGRGGRRRGGGHGVVVQ